MHPVAFIVAWYIHEDIGGLTYESPTGTNPYIRYLKYAHLCRTLIVLVVVFVIIGVVSSVYASPVLTREYQLKAAYLFNFARFVKWPSEHNEEANAHLRFCVIGLTPIGLALDQFIKDKTVQGRKPVIRHISHQNQLTGCEVLFISQSEQNSIIDILSVVEGAYILTVGETKDFIQRGGMIEFMIVENKLRFAINLEAAKRAHLEISSQLLKLAIIVLDSQREE